MAAADTTRTLRIGLAGLGRFGALHASVLSDLPGVTLAAVCDPDPTRVNEIGDRHGVYGRYPALEEMLDREQLDAVFLVTPEDLHAAQAKQVLARKLPLFLEKPMATSHAEGREILDAARAAGVHLQIGFVVRFDLQHAILRSEIANGEFGPLVSLRVKRNCSRAWFPTYGNRAHTIYETSIHDIDLLLWLVGQPCVSVYALDRNVSSMRYPDGCWALLRFADETVAMIETSWFVPSGAPANVVTPDWHGTIDARIEVVGTERTASISLLDTGMAIWRPDLTAQPETALWPEAFGSIGGALRQEDRHFVECVRTGAPSSIASAEDALEGLRIAEAIVRSTEEHQEIRLR